MARLVKREGCDASDWSQGVVENAPSRGISSQVEADFDVLQPLTGVRTRVVVFSGVQGRRIGHLWLQSGRGLTILGLFSGVANIVDASDCPRLRDALAESLSEGAARA